MVVEEMDDGVMEEAVLGVLIVDDGVDEELDVGTF